MARSFEFSIGVWRTQDGRDIQIPNLDDTHLFHIIQMLEAKGVAACSRAMQIEDEDSEATSDADVLAVVEALLSNASVNTVKRYRELIVEREKRIMAGHWNPVLSKPRGLPPLPGVASQASRSGVRSSSRCGR